jgi:hypothetical protein
MRRTTTAGPSLQFGANDLSLFAWHAQAFRALVVHRLAEVMRPCLDKAVGKNIREGAAWMIVFGETIKLAPLYAIQLGSTAEETSALARVLQRSFEPL